MHLALSAAARGRRVAEADRWKLDGYDSYDRSVDPQARADMVIKLDDPRHPAVRWAD